MLILSCFAVYTSTICMKMVYSSLVIEIIDRLGETKARVGLGLTAYYVVYAVSQLAIAPFVKKINIGKLMLYTVTTSAILYGIIPFTTQLYQLWILMGLNGIMHASVWGGCMYYFGKYLPTEMNELACSVMSMGFIGGTIVSYVIAPFFIMHGIWQYTFLLFAAIQFLSVALFVVIERRVEKYFHTHGPAESAIPANLKLDHPISAPKTGAGQMVVKIMVIAFATCFFINFFYYGMTNWFASYLNDVFGLATTYSVWISIILYLLSFVITNVCLMLCKVKRRWFSYILQLCGIVMLVFVVAHAFLYKAALLLGIILPSLFTALNRATGTIIASYLPLKIKAHVNAATTAMVLNAAASIGAALSTTVFGMIIDLGGWGVLFAAAVGIGFITLICLLLSAKAIQKSKIKF